MSTVVRHLPPRIAALAATTGSETVGGAQPVRALVGRAEELSRLRDLLDGVLVDGSRLALIGGVLVGLTTAKAIALVTRKPLMAVNHLEAHALTARLTDGIGFPYLLLLASGGHTQLVAVRGVGDYVRLGTTIDDAIGEAFDKVAKMLGLPYPGGPHVEQEAAKGNPERFAFPRPMQGRKEPNFSLSGLKTAVRIEAEKIAPLTPSDISDLCAGFQAAIVDVVVDRTRVGLRAFRDIAGHPTALVVAGGVAANQGMRQGLQRLAVEAGLKLVAPPLHLCGDNGAMIAWAGLERMRLGLIDDIAAPARARCSSALIVRPVTGSIQSGATSASGTRTKARAPIRGWGSVSAGSARTRSPWSRRPSARAC